jgi:hypothetical protein
MISSNIIEDRFRDNDSIDIFDRKKDIYKLFEYMDYLILIPKDNKYDYAFFFFSGFNENAGKYINLLKPFFENFSKISKIKFKIILPMLKRVNRDIYPYSNFIKFKDDRYEYVQTWYKLKYEEISNLKVSLINDNNNDNKNIIFPLRTGFETFEEIDDLVKNLILKELKKLGNQDKLIFSGFSQGGRYILYLLENLNIKPIFNICFKSPIFMYNIKNENNLIKNKISLKTWNYKCQDMDLLNKGDFHRNKFYLFYSINDKLLPFNEGLFSYALIKNEFDLVKIKIDSGVKHSLDYNSLEYLKEILLREIIKKNTSKF